MTLHSYLLSTLNREVKISDNTGTYIIEMKNGFYVLFGSEIENKFHRKMSKSLKDFMLNDVPQFQDLTSAYHFAREVEHANKTARQIVSITTFKKFNMWDM